MNQDVLRQRLYRHIIRSYREENRLRATGLHIKNSPDGSIVVYRQIQLGPFKLGKENPLIKIKQPYSLSDLVILNPKFDGLGRRIMGYLAQMGTINFFGRNLGGKGSRM